MHRMFWRILSARKAAELCRLAEIKKRAEAIKDMDMECSVKFSALFFPWELLLINVVLLRTEMVSVMDLQQLILPIFGNAEDIKAHFSEFLETLRQSPKAEGVERIYTHGEKEILAEKERRENGIPVNDNTMVELANLCNYLKMDFGAYFEDYELPKDSKFFSGNY